MVFSIAKKVFMPSVPSKHGILKILAVLFVIPAIVFSTLSLVSCISTSPGIPSLYLVSLTDGPAEKSEFSIRLGFFGICGVDSSTKSDVTTVCRPSSSSSSKSSTSVDELSAALFPEQEKASTNKEIRALVDTVLNLQSGIFMTPLAAGAVAFVLGLAFVFVHKRSLKRAEYYSRSVKAIKRVTYTLLVIAAAGFGGSALAITQAADALQYASVDGEIVFEAGKTVQVFQWIAFGCAVGFLAVVPAVVKPRAEAAYPDKEIV